MAIAETKPSRVSEKLTLSVADLYHGVSKIRDGDAAQTVCKLEVLC